MIHNLPDPYKKRENLISTRNSVIDRKLKSYWNRLMRDYDNKHRYEYDQISKMPFYIFQRSKNWTL